MWSAASAEQRTSSSAYREAGTGELKLAKGVQLKFANGSPLTAGGCFNAGDWDNRRVYDLFSSSWNKMLYTKNIGTNAKPAFLADGGDGG